MAGMAIIEIRGLTKRFGAVQAVDDLSFTVERGTITGFLGSNGAGNPVTGLWHSFWRGAANSSREAEWTAESRYASCALSL
jgi:ABC-type glutathione transport system ATPase component